MYEIKKKRSFFVKKAVSLMLSLVMIFVLLPSCGEKKEETPEPPVTVRLGALKGPTTIGAVKLLNDSEENNNDNEYTFTMAASANELLPQLMKDELDILAVPINLGSIAYQNSKDVQLLAVNTLGVLYIVEKGGDSVKTLSDLRGKTVYATGKGATPEYALSYLLAENGLTLGEDVTVEWKSEPTEIVAQMALEDSAVAMLPQPFVTVAQTKLEGLRVALDLTQEWESLGGDSRFVTAGWFVRREFAEEHPEAIKTFLREYAESAEYVSQNASEAAPLVEKYGIVKAPVAEKAIPHCGICCLTGDEMKTAVSGYLEVLYEQNPKAVGGALPGDDFYYAS